LVFPLRVRQGGILLSTGVLTMVGLLCTYCMWMLIRCKYRVMSR
ncbi:unnamed protein product, partial [Hapterophycus canaliculatus]